MTVFNKLIPKTGQKSNILQLILRIQSCLHTKTRRRSHFFKRVLADIPYESTQENSLQNTSKTNPVTFKRIVHYYQMDYNIRVQHCSTNENQSM